MTTPGSSHLAVVLGGGAARGLAHIGVLQVLEREGIRTDFIVGSSMGALIGALSARGLRAREIIDIARSFRFPRWFILGGTIRWESLFGAAAPALSGSFEALQIPLAITAVDLEAGNQVILREGSLEAAVRASTCVPGMFRPVKVGDRWLIDGGVANVLPVDVAWLAEPDVVVAIDLGDSGGRRVRQLDWRLTSVLSRLGEMIPNPATAKVAFEVMIRASEIMLDRQTALATAMTGPDLLIRPELGDIGLRDFDRLDEAVSAGNRAAEQALPALLRALERRSGERRTGERTVKLRYDPVCAMVVSPARARATSSHEGATIYFCSANCRDRFDREPHLYLKPRLRHEGGAGDERE